MNVSGGRTRTAIAVLSAAVAGLALAPAAHAQGITNPAAHPFPITVTIDGQTYSDGRDTLPGYDDEACTPIPGVQYDFAEGLVLYYDGDGQVLKTAQWSEWSRISSYEQWVKDQKTPTPTPTATATPTATSQATATPTASGGGGGTTTTTTTTNNPAATNQTSTSTTTKAPTKTQTTPKNSSTTKTQTTKNSSNKTQTTKTTTKSPSTTKPSSTATSTPSSSSSSSSTSKSTPSATATADSSTDAGPAAVTPAGDPALEASQPGGEVPVDGGNGTAVPAGNTVVAGNNVPAGTPGAANVPVAAGAADTSQYKLATQSVGSVGDTRVAGIGILAALVVLGIFCLIFGQARQQLFGRR